MTSTAMSYWIQSADFSSRELPPAPVADVLRAFEQHNWPAERSKQRMLEATGKESCPPGMGLVPGDGRLLHLCPLDGGQVELRYDYVRKRRFLFVVPWPQKGWVITDRLPMARTGEAITAFFANDHERLLRLCAAA